MLAGNEIPTGAEPIALAYAGHQFGGFVPQLGDGRAILLGEVVGTDGQRRDIQLKGAGRTPFSRGGDGRAALGPVLREYLVSEAMAALGIPTTRALAVVTTGERVMREEVLPGAVLTRVAASHIRVGTFEFFAARGDREALVALTAYALARHYPDAAGSGNDALALLECVIDAQANLVARWLGVGFVHGVMNTDNTAISGETIDYGPCAFLDEYDPNKKFSSIDHGGRYAFANQPRIAQWNMARLAEALLALIADDEEEAVRLATERLKRFSAALRGGAPAGPAREAGARARRAASDDRPRARRRSARTARGEPRRLHAVLPPPVRIRRRSRPPTPTWRPLFDEPGAFRTWAETWRQRLATEAGHRPRRARPRCGAPTPPSSPATTAWRRPSKPPSAAATSGPSSCSPTSSPRPYDDQPEHAELTAAPGPDQGVYQTFCGT